LNPSERSRSFQAQQAGLRVRQVLVGPLPSGAAGAERWRSVPGWCSVFSMRWSRFLVPMCGFVGPALRCWLKRCAVAGGFGASLARPGFRQIYTTGAEFSEPHAEGSEGPPAWRSSLSSCATTRRVVVDRRLRQRGGRVWLRCLCSTAACPCCVCDGPARLLGSAGWSRKKHRWTARCLATASAAASWQPCRVHGEVEPGTPAVQRPVSRWFKSSERRCGDCWMLDWRVI
jgi:hypothetical protein